MFGKPRSIGSMLLLHLLGLLLLLRPSGSQDATAVVDEYSEPDICLGWDIDSDSYRAMLDWDRDLAYETFEAEKLCEDTVLEMQERLVGKHGPALEIDVKLAMCSGDCDLMAYNVNQLIQSTQCTCEKLDEYFPYLSLPSGYSRTGPGPSEHKRLPKSWCERNPMFYLHRETGMLAVDTDTIFRGDPGGQFDPDDAPGENGQDSKMQCQHAGCEGELIYAKVAFDWYRAAKYGIIVGTDVPAEETFGDYCRSMECQWSAYTFKYCRCDQGYGEFPGELWCGWSAATRGGGSGVGVAQAALAAVALSVTLAAVWPLH